MRTDFDFDVASHFEEHHGRVAGIVLDEQQRYRDRLTGRKTSLFGGIEERAVVMLRPVGTAHAGRFPRHVTLSGSALDSMRHGRPPGWHGYVLMVGLLPDGQVWWSRLYDERFLAPKAGFFEEAARGFFRLDPHGAADALVSEVDMTQPPDRVVCRHESWVNRKCTSCGATGMLVIGVEVDVDEKPSPLLGGHGARW